MLTILAAGGCVSPAGNLSADQARTIQQELRRRAVQRFANAAYYKPRASSLGPAIDALAPLLVQKLPAQAHHDDVLSVQFGAVLDDRAGGLLVDPTLPTLYARYQPADPASGAWARVVFVWVYPAPEPTAGVVFRGLRMTLDPDGYPVVYEPLGGLADSSGVPGLVKPLFVDRSVETAAAARFGPPLPGRRFSIEPAIEEAPDLFVAGLLDQGPIPMGPYVYLDYPRSVATTLLCRCSPSQVDRFEVERWYDLRDLSELDRLGITMVNAFPRPRSCPARSAERGSMPGDITLRLRWPGEQDAPIEAPGAKGPRDSAPALIRAAGASP